MTEPSKGANPSPTPERIFQTAWGYTAPLILEAGIRNGVFDTLDAGPKNAAELSSATGASERGLRAICDALVGLDFLQKQGDGRYALTEESSMFLVSTKPSFAGGILRHTSRQLIPKWLSITEIVRTGKPAAAVNQQAEGAAFFHEFVEDIFPMSYPAAQVVAKHLKIAGISSDISVLDIATGSGVWGIALAQASPYVQVRAVDWEHVLDVTRRVTSRFNLASQFEFVGGDLLSVDFGSGHRVATLGHILHSEGEERSIKLLRRVYDALAPGGHIVIAEMVPDADRTGPAFPLLFAVNMLVNTDAGGTYSFDEISQWLAAAGFVGAHTLEAPSPSPLILATKPE